MDIESNCGLTFGKAFMAWAIRHLNESQLSELQSNAVHGIAVAELLERSGIEWSAEPGMAYS
ncbi:hypothetical protein LCM4573_16450 [Rhizobium sp. LCM 4573]|nr:hypothetical protein LCM4573_16450 [Rhizobium sp. LCM 4573]